MNPTRRKLAIATWGPPDEGNIFGKLTVNATNAQAWIADVREKTGEKVTITHLVGKAIALGLAKAPQINGRIAWGSYIPHDSVDITYLVSLEEGADLAKVKIANMDKKAVTEVAQELKRRSEKLRAGQDDEFEKSKGLLRALPTWILRPILQFTGWLTGSLGVSLGALGLEAYPFGSCIVTSVGMLGIDEAFAPHTPFAHVPVLVLVGAVRDVPAVVDGQIVIQAQLTLTATIDHRFVDGFQLATVAKTIRAVLENPAELA